MPTAAKASKAWSPRMSASGICATRKNNTADRTAVLLTQHEIARQGSPLPFFVSGHNLLEHHVSVFVELQPGPLPVLVVPDREVQLAGHIETLRQYRAARGRGQVIPAR